MRNGKRFGAVAIALLMAAVLAAPVLAADMTVGRFVQDLARHKNLNASDAPTAVDSLLAVGIRLPAKLDLGRTLTEGDVVDIAQSAGLNVTTSNPSATFDTDKADRFFQSFGSEFVGGNTANTTEGDYPHDGGEYGFPGNGNGPPFDPWTKGKGKGKGKGKNGRTEYEPE